VLVDGEKVDVCSSTFMHSHFDVVSHRRVSCEELADLLRGDFEKYYVACIGREISGSIGFALANYNQQGK
jgi:hypothetical protein